MVAVQGQHAGLRRGTWMSTLRHVLHMIVHALARISFGFGTGGHGSLTPHQRAGSCCTAFERSGAPGCNARPGEETTGKKKLFQFRDGITLLMARVASACLSQREMSNACFWDGHVFVCLGPLHFDDSIYIRLNKLLGTSASLLVTSALLVVTRSY